MEPAPLRLQKSACKNHQWPQENQERRHNIHRYRRSEVSQRNLIVDDLIRQDSSNAKRVGKQQNPEEPLSFTHESQATSFVRMGWKELYIKLRYASEKLKPEKEPPEPSKYQEMEQGTTDQ